jgi:SAM-dependent methyltransferase
VIDPREVEPTETTMTEAPSPQIERARNVWNAPGGHYDDISRTIADAIEHAVERLEPRPGERVLDLATGTGWASRCIARRFPGVHVSGLDIADRLLEHARRLAEREQLAIAYGVGNAEALPLEDASLDAVVSTFGIMFAAQPELAAAELGRVVKPGGRVVLANWADDSAVAAMFGILRRFMPAPPAGPSPFAWGRPEHVRELLGAQFELELEPGTNCFRYPSGESAWSFWREHYGPIRSLAAALDEAQRSELGRAMIAWHESFPSALGYEQPRRYWIVRGVRR